MKTKLTTVLFAAASVCGFAAEPAPMTNELPLTVKPKMANVQMNHSSWFSYLCMGLSDSRPNSMERVVPGLGLGLRFDLPVGAMDVSASYTGDSPFQEVKKYVCYEAPRVSYLYYISSKKDQSFYVGPGLAYGSLQSAKVKFNGFLPGILVGYEMNRLQDWRSFVQVGVSMPAVKTATINPKSWTLATLSDGPVAEFSVGFGY